MADQQGGQKKGKKFSITAPKARAGEVVSVLNYRMRPETWVEGKVVAVAAKESWFLPGFKWFYDVSVQSVHWTGAGRRSYVVSVPDKCIRKRDVRGEDGRCYECGNRIGHAMSCQSGPGGLGVTP